MREPFARPRKNLNPVLSLIFFLVSGVIFFSGYAYYSQYERNYEEALGKQLSAISLLKRQEVELYLDERRSDAALLSGNALFRESVGALIENPGDPSIRARLADWLDDYRAVCDGVFILDARGDVVFSSSEPNHPFAPGKSLLSGIQTLIRSGKTELLDLYRNETMDAVFFALVVPIVNPRLEDGVLVMRIDPETFLFPFISFWPEASDSAETLLVRRDGDDVVFLNNLRHRKNSALNLRIPVTQEDLPASQAVLGHEGPVAGKDYRNVPVIGDVRAIEGTSWFIVAKMDEEEAFRPVRERLFFLAAFMVILVFLAGFGLYYVSRREKQRHDRALIESAEAIRKSETKYRLLFRNLTAGFALHEIILGPDGKPSDYRFLEVNPEFENLTGLKAADILNRTVIEALPGTDTYWIETYGRVAITGVSERFERFSDELGKYYEVLAYSPEPGKFAVIVSDITSRKKTENALRLSEERYRRILAGLTNYLYSVRVEGGKARETTHTEACLAVTGYTSEEFQRDPYLWLEMVVPEDRESVVAQLARVLDGDSIPPILHRIRRKDGDIRWIVNTIIPHEDKHGILVSYDGVINDITERKAAEENLHALNLTLERRIAERTADLTASNRELESFAYSVSHDLRAPLRAVDGFSRFLSEDYGPVLDAEGNRLVKVIRDNVQKMDTLISDILSLSRVSMTELRKVRVDMKALAESSWAQACVENPVPSFSFAIADIPEAWGDAGLLGLVWTNLLSNAVKYSSRSPVKSVEVGGCVQHDRAVFFVRDRGAGFNPEYKDKLFGVFQRLHSGDEFEGNGVGLAIAQRILSRHGGKIWADGKLGEGATFWFDLPLGDTGNVRQA